MGFPSILDRRAGHPSSKSFQAGTKRKALIRGLSNYAGKYLKDLTGSLYGDHFFQQQNVPAEIFLDGFVHLDRFDHVEFRHLGDV